MIDKISDELAQRLARVAQRRGSTLEDLLTDYVEQAEQPNPPEQINFPADPYRFFELSVALICVSDLQGNFLYVNPAFQHVLGYDLDTLLSHTYHTLIHPDDLAATRTAEAGLRAGMDITYFENRYRSHNSGYRWLSWAATVSGEYVYAVALDVTEQKQLEQRLMQVSAQNERILRSIFDGYFLGDAEGNVLDVNQVYCDMVGYTRDELLHMTVFDLDTSMPPDQITDNGRRVINDDETIVIETQHRHKDGYLIDVEINSIQLQNGQIAGFIRNISERKQLERQLRHSEQLYRGLIDSQIDLVCRYTPDTILTYANEAYCAYFEQPREALIGSSFLRFTAANEREAIRSRIREVVADPAPRVRIFHSYDPDGRKQWIQWIDYGITDETGTVVEIQAVGRDVTLLIETQQHLAEREEMLTNIFENIPVMLVQFNPQGQVEYVNRFWVETLGYTAHEMRDHPDIMAAFYPDPEYRLEALEYMSSRNPGWRDFKTVARDGSIVDATWANVALSNGRNLGIGQLITHRIELENQRLYAYQLEAALEKERELREVKDHFVSLISHEFRTPLAVMATSLDLVMHYYDRLTPDRVFERLTAVQQQVGRMIDLMENALRFTTSSAGKTDFVPEEVEMYPLVERVVETLKLTDSAAHHITLSGDNGIVRADPKLIEHVITNLLTNALKYSPEASTIAITLSRSRDHWRFSIADQGIGIPKSDLPKLFEPFYRAGNARSHAGTGLGLSIVKDYVELHGGTVHAASQVGSGSTFSFTLPL